MSHEDEPSAGIRWYCNDGPNSDLVIGKLVFPPIFTLIRTEQNMVRGLLVIGHDKNGSRVTELPEMCILVYFLPCEASVTAQKGITLRVRGESLTNVTDGHDQTDNGRAAVCGPRVVPFRVPMNMQSTTLFMLAMPKVGAEKSPYHAVACVWTTH